MVEKQFNELNTNDRFIVDSIEYIKIDTVRVSCCKSINAQRVDNAAVTAFFADDITVQVNA